MAWGPWGAIVYRQSIMPLARPTRSIAIAWICEHATFNKNGTREIVLSNATHHRELPLIQVVWCFDSSSSLIERHYDV